MTDNDNTLTKRTNFQISIWKILQAYAPTSINLSVLYELWEFGSSWKLLLRITH